MLLSLPPSSRSKTNLKKETQSTQTGIKVPPHTIYIPFHTPEVTILIILNCLHTGLHMWWVQWK